MMWRVRTTLDDRPGILAEVADACGRHDINIVSMQVLVAAPEVTDEFVVSAPDGITDVEVADVFTSAGGTAVVVTRADAGAASDPTTRYLAGVHQVIEDGRDVADVLHELLAVGPPDVADYAGHDVLDLARRDGSVLRISRAFPFTPVERARAQALMSLVGDAGGDIPLIAPSTHHPLPLVRTASLSDIDSVAALHARCSIGTIYQRYQAPLRTPMTTRMARRLIRPEQGVALVVQVGLDLVGHGVLERIDDVWTFQLLIEDAWQGRGLGTLLVKQSAGRAKSLGAERLTFVSAGSTDQLLRAVGSAGFVARVERHEGFVHITVPLQAVREIAV